MVVHLLHHMFKLVGGDVLDAPKYAKLSSYGKTAEQYIDQLSSFYDDIKVESYRLMIEFVKDGSVENLKEDAETLRSLLK